MRLPFPRPEAFACTMRPVLAEETYCTRSVHDLVERVLPDVRLLLESWLMNSQKTAVEVVVRLRDFSADE